MPYWESVSLMRDRMGKVEPFVCELPVVKQFGTLQLHPKVTYFTGENGSGKSTLLEAIAVADGMNPEGGTRFLNQSSHSTHSKLYQAMRINRSIHYRARNDSFFLRSESLYNLATWIDQAFEGERHLSPYGEIPLHEQSHGELMLNLMTLRFLGKGIYLFDEPETALSPQRQLAFLVRLAELVDRQSQFIIVTHSPILLAYPDATIYEFSSLGMKPVRYEETETFRGMDTFIRRRERLLRDLFSETTAIDFLHSNSE